MGPGQQCQHQLCKFPEMFRAALDKEGVVANTNGDALAALKGAAKVVEADYEVPTWRMPPWSR